MKTYSQRLTEWARWDKCVDFGSPKSAWTNEMISAWIESGGNLELVIKLLSEKDKK